jgi:probable HAF family extracellular repeat protein
MNKIKTKQCLKMIIVGAALGLSNLTFAAAPAYTITDLGAPQGYPICTATAINNPGKVLGSCYTSDYSAGHAVLWSHGSITDLGALGATAINDRGQVAGTGQVGNDVQPIIWSNGTITALGTPPGYLTSQCYPTGIDNAGAVAGYCTTSDYSVNHAFRWSHGTITELGTLPGGIASAANGINNAGQVVGYGTYFPDVTNGSTIESHAILWSHGTLTDLGTLSNTGYDGYNSSIASALNNQGQVVGWSYTTIGTPPNENITQHAFLWQRGAMTDLDTLTGGIGSSFATAINDRGQVVGYAFLADFSLASFFYDKTTGMVDLSTLLPSNSGWTLYSVTGINNRGQIAAWGYMTGGDPFAWHALLLTPVAAQP